MGNALETLCGQAFGAGQIHMLGIYTQRSMVILFFSTFLLLPIYNFATPVLKLLGQEHEIAVLAGKFELSQLNSTDEVNILYVVGRDGRMFISITFAGKSPWELARRFEDHYILIKFVVDYVYSDRLVVFWLSGRTLMGPFYYRAAPHSAIGSGQNGDLTSMAPLSGNLGVICR
ncbi:hypothetical protein RND71_036402 [Anisodus tanguticus]|uniref:Uncharacterized protein n=1 Tax=Anisodus tanguticus TaxID=243964 RepID=A0AAE1R1R5_9SOLA|nr:hypothetical protein RND71_036402 [Anisodus tanguticus]